MARRQVIASEVEIEPEELEKIIQVVNIITRTSHYKRFNMSGTGYILNDRLADPGGLDGRRRLWDGAAPFQGGGSASFAREGAVILKIAMEYGRFVAPAYLLWLRAIIIRWTPKSSWSGGRARLATGGGTISLQAGLC